MKRGPKPTPTNLRLLQGGKPRENNEPQPPRPERDRARRDDRDLLARARAFGDVGGNTGKPVTPHRARRVDEQRRSDLDDQPGTGSGRKQAHGAADSARAPSRQCYYVTAIHRRCS